MDYNEYRYIFPPRPERKLNPVDIDKYDNGEFYGQPKYNGDACVVAIKGDEIIIRNRHNEPKNHVDKSIDFKSLAGVCPGWLVLCGEMLDKAKKDEHGDVIKGFVIWDIIVFDGKYLVGSTVEHRIMLLGVIFPGNAMRVGAAGMEQYKHMLFTAHAGIYKAPVYTGNFTALYKTLIETDMYEGLVLKRKFGKLELGFNEKNNAGWSVKCRKATRNYQF
jgi:hypothetical protein